MVSGGNGDLRAQRGAPLAARPGSRTKPPVNVSCASVPCPSRSNSTDRVVLDPEKLEKGLAQLVLTIVELLRQLLEKQALRRMEDGSLTDAQIERMGETFIKLKEKVAELEEVFGLSEEDLNIHLGPLGDLM